MASREEDSLMTDAVRRPSQSPGFVLRGPSTPVTELLRGTWRSRRLIRTLARKDFHVRYRRTVFGLLWAVGLPLLQGLVIAVVFSHLLGAARIGKTSDYAVFVFAGLVPWSFANQTVSVAST